MGDIFGPTSEIVENSILLLSQNLVHYFSMKLEVAIH